MNGLNKIILRGVVLTSLFLCGCERTTRTLAAGYRLERFDENGKYYLTSSADKSSGGGVFEGTVEEIGWNQDWILARVTKLASIDTIHDCVRMV